MRKYWELGDYEYTAFQNLSDASKVHSYFDLNLYP